MFPIIPQYYLTDRINYSVNVSKEELSKTQGGSTLKKPKITVTSIIEADSVSEDIKVDQILEKVQNETNEIQVYAESSILKCTSNIWTWLKQVHLAEDCYSYNIILYKEPSTSVLKVKSVRKISPDEKLVLWFSRDLLLILRIPLWLPITNILSEKQYMCHRCRFQCDMPNPIKIHLALECGTLSKSNLWNRLTDLTSPCEFSAEQSKITHLEVEDLAAHALEEHSPPRTDIPQKANSAFKPYKKSIEELKKSTERKEVELCSIMPNVLNNPVTPEVTGTNLLYKQAVEMETFVSNLGKFKQGHLCIYCGKVYSRKYGLKIHIRTHTGFKPLKCKFCLRPFGDPSNLNKHVRLHSEGETPYKCEQCGKLLVRKRDFDRHMKSRH